MMYAHAPSTLVMAMPLRNLALFGSVKVIKYIHTFNMGSEYRVEVQNTNLMRIIIRSKI